MHSYIKLPYVSTLCCKVNFHLFLQSYFKDWFASWAWDTHKIGNNYRDTLMKWYTNWYTNTWNKTHKLIYSIDDFFNGQIFKFAEFSCWWTEFWCKSGVRDRKRDRVFTVKQIFQLKPQKEPVNARRQRNTIGYAKVNQNTISYTKKPSRQSMSY